MITECTQLSLILGFYQFLLVLSTVIKWFGRWQNLYVGIYFQLLLAWFVSVSPVFCTVDASFLD